MKDQKEDSIRVCEVGLDVDECAENEICKPSGPRSRSGICSCKDGFVKDEKKNCIHKGNHYDQLRTLLVILQLLFIFRYSQSN